jgi:signal transduction histidine kinase
MTSIAVWRNWRRRLSQQLGDVSIRTKILIGVLAMVLIPGMAVTLQVRALMIRGLREQLQKQSILVAHAVGVHCTDLVACNDVKALDQILQDAWQYNQDLRYILVIDDDEHVLAYSLGPGFEQKNAFMMFGEKPTHIGNPYFQQGVTSHGETIWETTSPVVGGVGYVRVGLGERRMWNLVNKVTGRIALSFLVISLVGIASALTLTWLFTRPILELVAVTERVGRGDYDVQVRRRANDEIGDLAEAFNSMLSAIRQAEAIRNERERLRQVFLKRVIRAQEEERRRVARELHDETGQALASLMVGLRNVESAPTPSKMRTRLLELREILASTLDRVRRLAYDLRPSVLDDLGLLSALSIHAHQYQERFKVKVDVQVVGVDSGDLSPEVETTIYRIVQEALLNAARHASCTHIDVLLQVRDGQLSVIIEDNGCGFDVDQIFGKEHSQTKLGLYGMKERAELVGGDLEIESKPGKGCTIYLNVPFQGQNGQKQIVMG